MKRLTTALKWFAYGIGLGVLFAPRSGSETRAQLIQAVNRYLTEAFSSGQQAVQQMTRQAKDASDRLETQVQSASGAPAPNAATGTPPAAPGTTYTGGPA